MADSTTTIKEAIIENNKLIASKLKGKVNTGDIRTVARTGSYNNLTDTPTIPTNTNQLTNGAGFITGITKSDVTTALGYTPPTTDTVTTATTTGSGNAVTSITASNGALTITKGATFLTSHQDISGKANVSETGYSLAVNGTTVSLKNKSGTVLSSITTQDTNTTSVSATTTGSGNAVTAVTASGGTITVTKGATFLTSHQSLAGYATEDYVDTKVSNLVNSAPETLDTLNELAAALGNDKDFSTTVSTELGNKANTTEAGYSLAVSGTTLQLKNKAGTVLSTVTTQDTNTDTNTWRGMQNNLTTSNSSTSDSLSAYQGYLLANGSAKDNSAISGLSVSGKTITYTKRDGSTGTITTQDTNTTYGVATSSTAGLVKSSTTGTTANRDYAVQVNSDGTMKVNVPWTDTDTNTTYSSKSASSGGTDVSLVTTGEKYTWNSKTSNTGTVTSVATGTGLTGGTITTSGTISLASGVVTAGTAGTSSATSGSTLAVPYATFDTYGRCTGYGTHTHTVSGFLTSHQTMLYRPIKINGTQILANTSSTALDIRVGADLNITRNGGIVTIGRTYYNGYDNCYHAWGKISSTGNVYGSVTYYRIGAFVGILTINYSVVNGSGSVFKIADLETIAGLFGSEYGEDMDFSTPDTGQSGLAFVKDLSTGNYGYGLSSYLDTSGSIGIGRYYTTSGDFGAWQESMCGVGTVQLIVEEGSMNNL